LHHCYKELVGNEKWARRNYETTPKRSQIIISVEVGDDDDEEEHHKRPKGDEEERGSQPYKDELVSMIETKKALGDECKEGKLARWNELKTLEDEKWRSKTKTGEHLLALEEENVNKKRRRPTNMLSCSWVQTR
jgi:hypothetical protein